MKKNKKRKPYSPEYKNQVIELTKNIEVAEVTRKLGIKNIKTPATWVRY